MGNEVAKPSAARTGTSNEDLHRLLQWCIQQSTRLDDQFHPTRSILLNASPLPAALSSIDQSQLLSSIIGYTQPLLFTVDSLLNNNDPTQLPLPASSAIGGYSFHSTYANMTGLASNITHDENLSAPPTQHDSHTRGHPPPAQTLAHASCVERMEVAHKYLVLQALMSKLQKGVQHAMKLRERDKYYGARLDRRRQRDVEDKDYARMTEEQARNGERLQRITQRLDNAKDTMEWLYRDYRLAFVSHSLNELLRVLRGIQRQWQGRQGYGYPRRLGIGESGQIPPSTSHSGNGVRRAASLGNAPQSLAVQNAANSLQSPHMMLSPVSPPGLPTHSTMSPLSPRLNQPTQFTHPVHTHTSAAFPFSPINSPPAVHHPMPPPIPAHLQPRYIATPSNNSQLPLNTPSTTGSLPLTINTATPASITSLPPPSTHSIQSVQSLYTSQTTTPRPPPSAAYSHHNAPHHQYNQQLQGTAGGSGQAGGDVYDIRFWVGECERRQRLVDYACQSNERSALVSALNVIDGDFTASVSSMRLSLMSPRLVNLLQLQHRAFVYARDVKAAVINMSARLTTLDNAITQLKEENFRLYKQPGHEPLMQKNNDQMNRLLQEAAIEKRACRDLYKFFHASFAQHVYSKLEQEVIAQTADVHALYRELQRVERACVAMYGHVSAEPPALMFPLPQQQSQLGDGNSRSSAGSQQSTDSNRANGALSPQKVVVHYDKEVFGDIENARFSPQGVAHLHATQQLQHTPTSARTAVSPTGTLVNAAPSSLPHDDWQDDRITINRSGADEDEDGESGEERKESFVRRGAKPRTPTVSPKEKEVRTLSVSPREVVRPGHTRSRSDTGMLRSDVGAEKGNLMEFMRRRREIAAGGGFGGLSIPTAERKEPTSAPLSGNDSSPSRDSPSSTSSTSSHHSSRNSPHHSSRPPSVELSPQSHLAMPALAQMEQAYLQQQQQRDRAAAAAAGSAVGAGLAAELGGLTSPTRPQLPPRPRRMGSGSGEQLSPILSLSPSSPPVVERPSPEYPRPVSLSQGQFIPIAVLAPSSPTGPPFTRPSSTPPPAQLPPPVPAQPIEEPLMSLQQLLEKASQHPAPIPIPPTSPSAAAAAFQSPSSSATTPSSRATSPALSAIPRRVSLGSPTTPTSAGGLSPASVTPPPRRIPLMSPPRPLPLSSSAEAAIVQRNTEMNKSEMERVKQKGMENLSVREKILRLQQMRKEEEEEEELRRSKEEEWRASHAAERRPPPPAPPRLSDSLVRRSIASVSASPPAMHYRNKSSPQVISRGLPGIEGLPQSSGLSLQLSPATKELLQRGGSDVVYTYGRE